MGVPDSCSVIMQGTNFRSEMVTELTKMMGTVSQFTTAYHPATNGLTERFNTTLANMLAMYTNTEHTDWDEYIKSRDICLQHSQTE